VAQKDKYVLRYRRQNWRDLIDLSMTPSAHPPTHIIWPEGAPPFLLARSPEALEQIADLTGSGRVLMTGAVRGFASLDDGIRFANSFYIFGPGGALLATYDKAHLVPFGEYMPAADFFSRIGLTKVVDGPDGFISGPGPQTFDIPGAPPVGPLICYEIIFPGAVTGPRRPDWFANVTDDSWFGPSSGPYQHLLTARVRAIEEGIPIARDANTGISAVIDALGRVKASLPLGKKGVVDSPLPRALPATPYARLGGLGFLLLLAACGIGAFSRNARITFPPRGNSR
jgi:apolipoprotein N-acyltransferase